MDPNETLRMLRAAISAWEDTVGSHQGEHISAGGGMRDAALALDEWLTGGGFLPSDWERDRAGWVRSEHGPRPGDQDYDDDND